MATLRSLRRWLPTTLRAQLMLLVCGALVVSMIAHAAYTIHQQSTLAQGSLNGRARALASTLAAASENPILTNKLDVIEELILQAAASTDVLGIQIFDANGMQLGKAEHRPGQPPRLVFASAGRRSDMPAQAQPQLSLTLSGENPTILAWHPVAAGRLIGWTQVELDARPLAEIGTQIWRSTALGATLSVLGGALLLWWLLKVPMRALDRSREFALGLRDARGQQLESIEGPQETRDLGQALNHASIRLHELRTDLESAIASLRQQEIVLSDANAQLQTIFSLSPDGLAAFDEQGVLRYANDAFFRMIGSPPGDPALDSDTALDARLRGVCAQPQDYPGLQACFAPRGASAEAPHPAPLVLSLSASPVRVLALIGQAGVSPSVNRLLYLRDITRETEMDRLKSEFLTAAAHELRTPMTSIYGFTELLMKREFDPERRRQMLSRIHHQSEAMMTVIQQLLDLSGLDAHRGANLHPEICQLEALVREGLAGFRLPDGRDPPRLDCDPTPVLLRIDRHQLIQVLRNLLSNAYKYSADGSAVRVEIGPEGLLQGCLIVSDQGIGMTEEQRERAFERFYRADPSGHRLGAGLGLSLVREIVSLHGGTVDISSAPGAGTRVRVLLPALPASTAPQDGTACATASPEPLTPA